MTTRRKTAVSLAPELVEHARRAVAAGRASSVSAYVAAAMQERALADDRTARGAGQLCGVAGTADVVDASVGPCARRRGHRILTSDPDALRRLDATAQLVGV